jgi:hypothetical protein
MVEKTVGVIAAGAEVAVAEGEEPLLPQAVSTAAAITRARAAARRCVEFVSMAGLQDRW